MIKKMILPLLFFTCLTACDDHGAKAEGKRVEEARSVCGKLCSYPTQVSQRIIGMVVNEQIPIQKIRFNYSGKDNDPAFVFSKTQSGLEYKKVPAYLRADNAEGDWHFNAEFNLGTFPDFGSEKYAAGMKNEIVAFAPGIKQSVCENISKELLGAEKVPQLLSDQSALYKKDMIRNESNDYVVPLSTGPELANPVLKSSRSGCFLSKNREEYVFFMGIFLN